MKRVVNSKFGRVEKVPFMEYTENKLMPNEVLVENELFGLSPVDFKIKDMNN
jgi:NADPH:quinone reductase-like Zn-dependent oxidoreductase